jgi:hypothetical protein
LTGVLHIFCAFAFLVVLMPKKGPHPAAIHEHPDYCFASFRYQSGAIRSGQFHRQALFSTADRRRGGDVRRLRHVYGAADDSHGGRHGNS